LTGSLDRPKWSQAVPYGTVLLKGGSLQVGQAEQDVFSSNYQTPKTISLKAFFMDDTEISNNEYRQFVHWVRDSIAHTIMGNMEEDENGNELINWETPLDWTDPDFIEEVSEMIFQGGDMVFGGHELDTRRLNYVYQTFDFRAAAANKDRARSRKDFVRKYNVNVYPDTLVWIRDFVKEDGGSYNEPQALTYFSHPSFDEYPVVGVSWDQANAFCNWRSKIFNGFRYKNELYQQLEFRLPTEFEWEYAAKGGRNIATYPWGGPYTRNDRGCVLANFKPGRGNYTMDGNLYTGPVYQYNPNDFGLFNMSGNVAEWTNTTFDESAQWFTHDLNPDFRYAPENPNDVVMQRKVVRGGSWNDVGHLIKTSTRSYEYGDSAKSTIGFRCVMDVIGTGQTGR
jgi:gliding motility-associated lipoprotein GldK